VQCRRKGKIANKSLLTVAFKCSEFSQRVDERSTSYEQSRIRDSRPPSDIARDTVFIYLFGAKFCQLKRAFIKLVQGEV
jgi:hypothetical protein